MTDTTIMPWGKFKGEKMGNVPAPYLLWLYNENKAHGEMKAYIIDNMQILRLQAANNK